MLERLTALLAQLRAWMAENERAHRNARVGPCCSSPDQIYAARSEGEKRGHE